MCSLYKCSIYGYSRFLDLRLYTNMVLIIVVDRWFNHFVIIFYYYNTSYILPSHCIQPTQFKCSCLLTFFQLSTWKWAMKRAETCSWSSCNKLYISLPPYSCVRQVYTLQSSLFGSQREVTGERRRLHNEELNDLYSSPYIVRVIKSRRMRWAGHVARMGEESRVYRVLVGKPEGRNRWGDLGVDGWIILERISSWDVGIWTGLGWPRIETGGGRLWVR